MEKVLNNSFFMSGTRVLTENGVVNIDHLKEGTLVLNSDNEYVEVLEVQQGDDMEEFELTTMDGICFHITNNQFFYVSQKKKGIFSVPQRKMACKLTKDDYLVSHYEIDGTGHIYYQYDEFKSFKKTGKMRKTYNIIVDGNHTFVANEKIVYDNSIMIKA